MQKYFIFVKKFENTYFKGKKFCKARDHCHCNLKYSVPEKAPIAFYN